MKAPAPPSPPAPPAPAERSPLDDLDLNLLRVFDVVYRERNLTRAAEALALTQSAVSHALARLRVHVDDPLFRREGRGVAPTPLATRLAPGVHEALAGLARTLKARRAFDPRRDLGRVVLSMSDELEPAILPEVASVLAREAPGAALSSVGTDRRRVEADLATEALDLLLDVPWPWGPDLAGECVLRDELCVVASRRRPRLDGESYAAARHVVVAPGRRGAGLDEDALAPRGLRRDVALRTQRYETACRLVADSDLLLTIPRYLAEVSQARASLRLFPLPVPLPPIEVHLVWHRTREDDPAIRWLRATLRAALAELDRAHEPLRSRERR